jgi:hypothetical protein
MRLVSALMVILACGFAMVRGWDVVEFAIAQRSIDPHSEASDSLREWTEVPGVAGAARQALLVHMGSGDAGKRTEALASLLEVRPLASLYWLSLAGMRVVGGALQEQVLSALMMSRITGPNEAGVMVQRGIFGLLQWEMLPEQVRVQTARDLAGAMVEGSMTDGAITVIRGVLARKVDETRSEIAGMLALEQVSSARLAQIGL